jgi:hypothetical protein
MCLHENLAKPHSVLDTAPEQLLTSRHQKKQCFSEKNKIPVSFHARTDTESLNEQ